VRRHRGPSVATWLLGCFLPASYRGAILGDLVEEYEIRARSASRPAATRWFWRQVWCSIPPVLWLGIRRGAWLTTVGVAIGAYVVAGMIEFAGVAAIVRLLGPDAWALRALSALVGLGTIVMGGYFAARIRPGAATALAVIVLLVVVTLFVAVPESAPLWYGLTFLMVGPVAALAGGALCRIRRPRRTL
jgi:hypothetical protein